MIRHIILFALLIFTASVLALSCRQQESVEYKTLLVGFDPALDKESEREWAKLCDILHTNHIGLTGFAGITAMYDVQARQEDLARQLISNAFATGIVSAEKLGLQLVSRPPSRSRTGQQPPPK